MNKIFKVIYSKTRHCYVVVSELAKSHCKTTQSHTARSKTALTAAVLLALGTFSVASVFMPITAEAADKTRTDGSNFVGVERTDGLFDDSDYANYKGQGAHGADSITIGLKASGSDGTITIGDRRAEKSLGSVYVGRGPGMPTGKVLPSETDNGYWATSVGYQSDATGYGSIAIGSNATANNSYDKDSTGHGIILRKPSGDGKSDVLNGKPDIQRASVAIGYGASADNGNIAIGSYSDASTDLRTAKTNDGEEIKSYLTDTKADSYVSVGKTGALRRISNVADGASASDVATVGQLQALAAKSGTYKAGFGIEITPDTTTKENTIKLSRNLGRDMDSTDNATLVADESKSALVLGGRVEEGQSKNGQVVEKPYGAFGQDSVVVGGANNIADKDGAAAVVVGGTTNTASAQYSTVAGGNNNDAFGNESSIFGGFDNDAFGAHATLSGGSMNKAHGEAASVFGGGVNNALGASSVAVGGLQSTVNGAFAVGLAGGSTNADYALAAGNGANVTVENGTAIGYQATANKEGTIAFGHDKGDVSTYTVTWEKRTDGKTNADGTDYDYTKPIVKADESKNYTKAYYNRLVKVADGVDAHDVVVMEQLDKAKTELTKDLSVNAGWGINIADEKDPKTGEVTKKNVISLNRNLGTNNGNTEANYNGKVYNGKVSFEAKGKNSLILGGEASTTLDTNVTAGTDGDYSVLVGGYNNSVKSAGKRAVVAAGSYNKASGENSAVIGGSYNQASGDNSVVIGGGAFSDDQGNQASGQFSTIIGGDGNKAKGINDVVSGGYQNITSGSSSFIGGGQSNKALGFATAILGGAYNMGVDDTTVVGGQLNLAVSYGAFAAGGSANQVAGFMSAAIGGEKQRVIGNYSTAIGGASTGIDAEHATAIGSHAVVTSKNGLALGYKATADKEGTISFGHDKGDVSGYESKIEYGPYGYYSGEVESYLVPPASGEDARSVVYTPTYYESAEYNRLVKVDDGKNAHDAVVMEQLKPYTKSDASNIGNNLKSYTVGEDGETITEADATDDQKKTNKDDWGKALGAEPFTTGTSDAATDASTSDQLVTGKTLYNYDAPVAETGKKLNYVSANNTTGQNLSALDAQVADNASKLNDKTHNIKYYSVSDNAPTLGFDSYSNAGNDGAKGRGSMAAGFVTHADGIASTVAGSYSGVINSGNVQGLDLRGAAALSYGTFNVNQNTDTAKEHSGVANSIVGQANMTTNSNAAIIYGAGNTVTDSYRPINDKKVAGILGSISDPTKLSEAMQNAVKDSGGQVMVMGGGNNVESAYMSQVVGVGNTVKGNQVENTKGEWGTDTSDTAIKDYNSEKSSQYNYVDGFNNEVINGKHDYIIGANNKLSGDSYDDDQANPIKRSNKSNIVIGDNHTLTRKQNTVIIGSSDTENTQTIARDAVIIGHNANATSATGADNAVAIGRAATATGGNAVTIGVNTKAGDNSITIGSESSAISGENIAIGRYAKVKGYEVTKAVALGQMANALVADGVAIGSDSIATVAGNSVKGYDPTTGQTSTDTTATWKATKVAVSIGKADGTVTRQINGVAAGTNDTDAVNVAQLKKLEGMKANVDASNIGKNLKGADGKTVSTEEITANENAWGAALGTGKVADPNATGETSAENNGSQQLVTGGTVFNETRISAKDDNGQAKTYNYLNANNSAGKNLEVLDSALKTVSTTAGAHTALTVEGNTPAGTGKDAKTNEDVYAGKNILLHESTDENGKVTYDLKLAKDINIGKPGKDGEDGKIGIDGKDGHIGLNGSDGITVRGLDGENGAPGKDGVTITGPKGEAGKDGIDGKVGISGTDGKDAVSISGKNGVGHIGLTGPAGTNGKDGASIDITVKNGYDKNGVNGAKGVDGKDGITRIVYEDKTGEHQVATMEDGMKYAGDDAQNDATKVIAKKLNNTLDIIGGADNKNLTEGNIGVNSTDKGQLKVQLAKDLKGITSISNQTTTKDGDKDVTTGAKITLGSDGTTTITGGDVNVGGNKVTNIKSALDGAKDAEGKDVTIATATGDVLKNAANLGDLQKVYNDVNAKADKANTSHTALTVEGGTSAGTQDEKTKQDVYAGKNILLHESTDENGKVTYDLKLAKDINIGKPGKDGEDGKIGIDGKDGHIGLNGSDGITVRGLDGENGAPGKDGVTITGPKGEAGKDGIDGKVGISGTDGKDAVSISGKNGVGHIGLTGPAGTNGKDGASIDITVKNGYDDAAKGIDGSKGVDGKVGEDGITRIVYTDKTGEHQVATMEDGLKFKGDDSTVIAKKLNNTLDIIGGADSKNLTEGNIGVNSDGDKLKVQLSKDLTGMNSTTYTTTTGEGESATTSTTVVNGNGLTITDGPSITNKGIDSGNKVITNVGSGIETDANGKYTVTDQNKGNAANIGDVQNMVNEAVNSAADTTNKALAGKANIDASNIGANLKNADGSVASAEDQKTNAEKWGSAIGTGEIKADDGRMVTGKTVYDEVRPKVDGSYVKKDKTTGENLSALDSKIGSLDQDGNYIKKDDSVSKNLSTLDTQVKNNAESIQNITNNVKNLSNNAVQYDEGSNKTKVTLGGEGGTTITNVKDGTLSENSSDAVNGKQLYNEQKAREEADKAIAENVTNNTNEITKIKNGEGFTDTGKTIIKNLSKDAVQVKAGDRIKVDEATDEKTGNKTYTISANNNGTVAKDDGNLISGGTLYKEVHVDKDGSYIKGSQTVGQNLSALDSGLKTTSDLIHTNTKGDTIQIGGNSTATKIDINGKDGKGRVITGVVSDANDPNSAANVGYVNGLTAANTQQIYRDMNNAYSRLDTNINRAAAGSNALAALHPLDFDPADKASFAVGYGHYRNANAAAVGAFYQPNANTMVNMGISLGNGDPGFNAGVSFKIGKGSAYNGVSKAEMAQTIHDQATEISAIKADDAAKDKRIDALEKENQEMKKQIQEILARLNG